METPANTIESLFEQIEVYGKTTLELSKLKALQTASVAATSLVSRTAVIATVGLCAVFLNIGIALFLGELFGKACYGFFIVSAIFLLEALVFHFYLHKWIKKPISDLIISNF